MHMNGQQFAIWIKSNILWEEWPRWGGATQAKSLATHSPPILHTIHDSSAEIKLGNSLQLAERWAKCGSRDANQMMTQSLWAPVFLMSISVLPALG